MNITFFGTTVLLFDDGVDQIIFDAHFTRPSLLKFLFGKISSNHIIVDKIIEQYKIDRLKGIFISHTHYDHVLDAPYLSIKTGASIYGTYSTMNVAKGGGVNQDKIVLYDIDNIYKIGNFEIEIIPSLHSKTHWYNNDLGKIIDRPLIQPARRRDFKEGGSFDFVVKHSGKTYLIRPSCNYIEGQLNEIKADVLYLGIGAMSKRDNRFKEIFFKETIEKVNPDLVIPIHWDNFFNTLDKQKYDFPFNLDKPQESIHDLKDYCEKNNIRCEIQSPLTSIKL